MNTEQQIVTDLYDESSNAPKKFVADLYDEPFDREKEMIEQTNLLRLINAKLTFFTVVLIVGIICLILAELYSY